MLAENYLATFGCSSNEAVVVIFSGTDEAQRAIRELKRWQKTFRQRRRR
jgi:hypothetical protein